MRFVVILGQLCGIATLHNIISPVYMYYFYDVLFKCYPIYSRLMGMENDSNMFVVNKAKTYMYVRGRAIHYAYSVQSSTCMYSSSIRLEM